jgi:hypothetical protein
MQKNISRSKVLINVVPKLHASKKEFNSGRCNHCGGSFKNEFDMKTCIMTFPARAHDTGFHIKLIFKRTSAMITSTRVKFFFTCVKFWHNIYQNFAPRNIFLHF